MQQKEAFFWIIGAQLVHKTLKKYADRINQENHKELCSKLPILSFSNYICHMSTPYKPVTKDTAAQFLSVSKRTIDNWISGGILPMPTTIGRRVYWHPDVFRAWQDKQFGLQPTAEIQKDKSRKGRPRATLN